MGGLRKFLGVKDIEYVALHAAFPNSKIILTSPVSDAESWPIVISGPEHQINYLYPLLRTMNRICPLLPSGEGWVGIQHENANKINLFYVYGDKKIQSLELQEDKARKIELLISRFMEDAARYADLKFSSLSVIEVVWEGKLVLSGRVALPGNFRNGSIILPDIWLH